MALGVLVDPEVLVFAKTAKDGAAHIMVLLAALDLLEVRVLPAMQAERETLV